MVSGSVGAFTVGLIILSFDTSTRSAPSNRPLDEKNSTSANVDSNQATPPSCGGTPKLMKIELSERFKNLREELLSGSNWNNYEVDNYRWQHMDLTYSVHYYSTYDHKMVDEVLEMAVEKWAAVTPLEFTQLVDNSDKADMTLQFVPALDYTDTGMTAACTPTPYYDERTLEMEFSLQMPWTHKRRDGINAICTATHEFGHALGLLHSEVVGAIMHRQMIAWNLGRMDCDLHQDDIDGIQSLYGSKDGTVSRKKTEEDLEFERQAREWKKNRSFKNRIKNGIKGWFVD